MRRQPVLILGGSSEASALTRALAAHPTIDATLSLAGRTLEPLNLPIRTRTGGFGGVAGLAAYLAREKIAVLVDATHPFAARMSENARLAAAAAAIPLIRLTRAAWRSGPGDRWTEVADMAAAAEALGPAPCRVFLTVGRLQLAPFAATPRHRYLVRTIDPVGSDHGFRDAQFIHARGPFDAAAEASLMRQHHIDRVVTKNSGGMASAGKLGAARMLGLPVILVRPPVEAVGAVMDVADVIAAIESHRVPPTPCIAGRQAPRGV